MLNQELHAKINPDFELAERVLVYLSQTISKFEFYSPSNLELLKNINSRITINEHVRIQNYISFYILANYD